MAIHIGTSGWVYNHWRTIFYPKELKQHDWFAFYAQHFDTVEINYSFYRLPSQSVFDAWREQAPSGFLYAVKFSRFLTHVKKLKDPEQPIQTFFERADHLAKTIGPILYQLPPSWEINLPRFQSFCEALPKNYHHVIEFRNPSWLTEEVFQLMKRHHISHCIHDKLEFDIPLPITASPIYIRFHGDSAPTGDYGDTFLEKWAGQIDDWNKQSYDIFIYFNNDFEGYALKNAMGLKKLLRMD
ncbi:DUF72 domain-containing protein [bacterium]|nr:DUF72 domain-containing protein [bacterium]